MRERLECIPVGWLAPVIVFLEEEERREISKSAREIRKLGKEAVGNELDLFGDRTAVTYYLPKRIVVP